jgi:uncharacterized protein YaiE (UPF0345 family)
MVRLEPDHEVLRASFGTASAGDTTIVAAVAGNAILVLNFHLYSNGTTTVNLMSGANYLFGNADAGAALAAGGQLNLASPSGVVKTVAGEALIIKNSAAVGIAGSITYVLL